ncbi:MAG: retroviral-like aspartic protease family protein [Pseudomonadales bacterium]|nr:retroviral-like aspartic protease family protein [Pseudomonadales bacterium]
MKSVTSVVAWILVGSVIGWTARPVIYPTITSVMYEQSGHMIDREAQGELPLVFESKSTTPQIISRTTSLGTSVLIPTVLQLIEQQKVKQTLDLLQNNDVYLTDNADINLAFRNNLHQLNGQKNWQTLSQWVRFFLEAGYTDSLLYSMDASIKRHQGDLLAATHALFLAKYYGETEDESINVQTDIENLVIDMMNRYRENSATIGRKLALDVMHVATEKQPENPLFGLEIAVLYADAGNTSLAIETLNFIPYSEKYQDAVVALKSRLLSELNNTEQVTTAIPLQQIGHHFHVTAIINQERTLDLLIDTGATTTALGRDTISLLKAVNILGVKEGSVAISTANGAAEVDYYRANLFAIGEFAVEDFELLEVEMSGSQDMDGLLGMNFLSLFEFEIDQTNRQLFLTPKNN